MDNNNNLPNPNPAHITSPPIESWQLADFNAILAQLTDLVTQPPILATTDNIAAFLDQLSFELAFIDDQLDPTTR